MSTFRLTIEVKNKQNHILKHLVLACAGLHLNFRQDSFCLIFTLIALGNGGCCQFAFSKITLKKQYHISTFSVNSLPNKKANPTYLSKDCMNYYYIGICFIVVQWAEKRGGRQALEGLWDKRQQKYIVECQKSFLHQIL